MNKPCVSTLTVLAALLLANCSFTSSHIIPVQSPPLKVPSDAEPIVESAHKNAIQKIDNCIKRDLTIGWSARKYWCAKQPVIKAKSRYVSLRPISRLSKPSLNPEIPQIESSVVASLTAPKETVQPAVTISKKEKPVPSFARLAQAASRLPSSIAFAKNIRVLGPKGKLSAVHIIDAVAQAKSVKLRGLFLQDEIKEDSKTYREILSVGRALAVRKLWKEKGIDVKGIKILHHDPEKFGRSVEVYING